MVDNILGCSGHKEAADAGDKKMPYEKPVVMSIRLFADQVLQGCKAVIPCPIIHPGRTS